MDFMATFVDLAHGTYPSVFKGHKITPMEGISLVPVFEGKERKGHEALFNEHNGGRYVRYQDWKLVSLDRDSTWHLYRINDDETELNDLSATYPAKVHELDSMWHRWAMRDQVFPKPRRD